MVFARNSGPHGAGCGNAEVASALPAIREASALEHDHLSVPARFALFEFDIRGGFGHRVAVVAVPEAGGAAAVEENLEFNGLVEVKRIIVVDIEEEEASADTMFSLDGFEDGEAFFYGNFQPEGITVPR